jgi:hypothetical protein
VPSPPPAAAAASAPPAQIPPADVIHSALSDHAFIVNYQRAHNDATLEQIQVALVAAHHPHHSLATISRTLSDAGFTSKQLIVEPAAKNSPAVKRKRLEWVQQWQTLLTADNTVFLDETSFNASMSRNRGRSEKGVKAVAHKQTLIGTSFSILAAVSPRGGLLLWRIREKLKPEEKGKRTTVHWFTEFVRELLPLLPPTHHFIIADNSNQHSERDVTAMLVQERANCSFLHLPPYSPDLNPIENCFNVWKAGIKRVENMSKHTLQQAMEAATSHITPAVVAHAFAHSKQEAYPRALAQLDF